MMSQPSSTHDETDELLYLRAEVARLRKDQARVTAIDQLATDQRRAMRRAGIVVQRLGNDGMVCIPTSDAWEKRAWDLVGAELKALRLRPTREEAEFLALLRLAIGVALALDLPMITSPAELLGAVQQLAGAQKWPVNE